MLDPVRFSRTSEMTTAMRERIQQVVVRRLKRDVDAVSATPRFCRRHPPRAIALEENVLEAALAEAFSGFRAAIRNLVRQQAKQTRHAGHFAVEILDKRLLSCPTAFTGARANRHRCRFRALEPAPHRPLPAALRLSVEPFAPRAAQRPHRPLRPGTRRHRASLRERRTAGSALSRSRHPQGLRDPGRLGILKRDFRRGRLYRSVRVAASTA